MIDRRLPWLLALPLMVAGSVLRISSATPSFPQALTVRREREESSTR